MRYLFQLLIITTVFMIPGCYSDYQMPMHQVDCHVDFSNHARHHALQGILDRFAEELPGLAVTVTDADGQVWSGASGFANIEENELMTPCHLQYGASIIKSYVSISILQLIEIGELAMDDQISDHLSEEILALLPQVDGVTIEHLLTHTSGWKDVFEISFLTDYFNDPMATYTTAEFLKYIKNTKPIGKPGEQHYYSDANFMILTIIIDQITGSHIRYIEQNILEPLSLNDTYYHNKDYPNMHGIAAAYMDQYSDGRLENVSLKLNHLTSQIHGGGGIISTPSDLAGFVDGVFDGRLIGGETLDQILTTRFENENEEQSHSHYGYGFMFIPDEEHGDWIGHTGLQIGAASYVYRNIETGATISVMTNIGTFFSNHYMSVVYGHLWYELVEAIH
ncbi:MAG: beta-lactamase family protein [Cyclobacteriaceae bacterium]